MLKIPMTEPSVPFFMYSESIANGRAKMLAQPIPATAISAKIILVFVKNAIPKKAAAIDIKDIAWIFLLPYFEDKIPIGIATIKQIRLNIAKHIEAKFVPKSVALSYVFLVIALAIVY